MSGPNRFMPGPGSSFGYNGGPPTSGQGQPAAPGGPPGSNFYSSPSPFAYGGGNAPPNAPPTGMGGPPPSGINGPPPSGMGGPPSSMGGPGPNVAQPPKSMFYNVAGGTPTPSTVAGPPASVNSGNMPPPPSTNSGGGFGGFGTSGPPTSGFSQSVPPTGPPTGFGAPTSNNGMVPAYPGQIYGVPPQNSTVGMPSEFDQTNVHDGQGNYNTLPSLSEIDLAIQCDPQFIRTTVNKLHISQTATSATKIPLSVICKPMAGDIGNSNDKIELVDFGVTGIVRCKRCRTYINPFVSWLDNGRRWRCNICGMLNDVPTSYFSHLDNNGQRRDRDQRPELSRCSVEFVAPGDYMVRPPQPPVYFFVIDVSSTSAQSGMLDSCVRAIKASLDEIPGQSRTQIGFITCDTSVHFYNLKSSLSSPQMLVVSDLDDIKLPLPEDLLVNLQDSRKVVDAFLEALPSMFVNTNVNFSCTGAALQAAKKIIQHIGGKLLLFQSNLPTVGEGSLKVRENPRALGTDKEHLLLASDDVWYRNNAVDFSRLQISVDTFLFSPQYTDLSTISTLSKLTAGSTFYYPGFYGKVDGRKFEKDLRHCLTRATAFEAVMRIRATRGIRITNFYGNHFMRGQDLMSLPNCTSDSTFAVDLAYDEPTLAAQVITIQAALLYTSSCGERRIRVHTHILPVTQSIPDVIETFDVDAAVNVLIKQAAEIAIKSGFDNARNRIHQIAVEMIRGSRAQTAPSYGAMPNYGQPTDQGAPVTMQLLPLYSMAIQKCVGLRGGQEVRTDERAFYLQLIANMDVEESKVFVYPRLFSIHDMPADAGMPSENPEDESLVAGPFRILLPPILNLSHERLQSNGIYLIENGYEMLMRVGRAVSPDLLFAIFGVPSLDGVDISCLDVKTGDNELGNRVSAVLIALRHSRPGRYMQMRIVREGDGLAEAYLARYLVEDRAPFHGGSMSYPEYHGFITKQVLGGN